MATRRVSGDAKRAQSIMMLAAVEGDAGFTKSRNPTG